MDDVLIVGYGSQGRPQALNLRDSGFSVSTYLKPHSSKIDIALKDKINVCSDIKTQIKDYDTIVLLIPDSLQSDFYNEYIHSNVNSGLTLIFAHGYNIHYNKISPRNDINVVLVAPSAQGNAVREFYKSGFATFIAVHNDFTGNAWGHAERYAKAIGSNIIIKTTFEEETEVDLFAEQAVLCGGLHALIKTSFETLVSAGYSPEMSYFSCLKEVLPLAKLISEEGINGMYNNISDTAKYGSWTRGEAISNHLKPLFENILEQIKTGKFADERDAEKHYNIPSDFSKHTINKLHQLYLKNKRGD